ncbi:hypothetical protein DVH24_032262, partial [Malus domestica]
STVRDCKPCGTTIIPYPLSTRLGCGDPLHFRFKCNYFTGQVSFVGPNDALFRVISINSSTQRIFIQGFHTENVDNSDPRNRAAKQINPSFPFKVISPGNADPGNFSSEVLSSGGPKVVEMGWELPMEPTCTTSADCRDWAHSICKRARDGKKRCLCETNFRWNDLLLRCTQGENIMLGIKFRSCMCHLANQIFMLIRVLQNQGHLLGPPKEEHTRRKLPLSLIIVAMLLSVIFLACIVISIYIWRRNMNNKRDQIRRGQFDSERRVKELIDTREFKEEEGIDVPFFDMQTILDATDNFSNENKLGQGGYGPGMFLGGQEIAVKRLSRVSGQGLQEFRNEVVLIAKLQHRNLWLHGSGVYIGRNFLNEIRCFIFGVVLLEIINGKKNTGFYQSEQTFSLINYAWRLWTENKVLDLMDKTLDESCNKNQFIQCVNVGLLCVQEDPNDRPAMSNVITMLDSETATSPAPKQPGFLTRRGNSSTASSSKPEAISEITTSIVEGIRFRGFQL